MNKNSNFKNFEGGHIIAGIILVTVGCVLLLRALGFLFPGWLFTWPMILILIGFYSGVKHNFKNNSWLILIAIGSFFLLNKIVPDLRLDPFFWPLLIIGAGILFILRPRFGGSNTAVIDIKNDKDYIKWQNVDGGSPAAADQPLNSGSNYIRVSSVFSGVNRKVLSKNFEGAQITSVFGGVEMDFSQADITAPAMIKVEVAFGGIKLIVPPHWAVQNEIDGIFHGVEDKRRFNVAPDINPNKVIILKGSVFFGGVDIKNS